MIAQKNRKMPLEILTILAIGWSGCGGMKSQNFVAPTSNESVPHVVEARELFRDAQTNMLMELANSDEDEKLVRQRAVTLDATVLQNAVQLVQDAVTSASMVPTQLVMNFFSDTRITVEIESLEVPDSGNIVLMGHVAGEDESAVTLVLTDGILVGDVRRARVNETFEIRHVAGDIHLIRLTQPKNDEGDCHAVETDPGDDDELGEGEGAQVGSGHESSLELAEAALSSDAVESGIDNLQSTPVIDILVAYTPQARAYQGGTSAMQALIQLGITDTNQALASSGSSLQVRLAGTLETRQNETGVWRSDLQALKGKSDGRWDEVHAERIRVGADQVTLIGRYSGSKVTGIGFINASVASAFTVVKSSAFKQYTFSHELGHNLGLRHEDGYVNATGRFRTIIAYGNYPRIRRFSNPDRTYNGYLTGNSAHNEIRVINRNSLFVR